MTETTFFTLISLFCGGMGFVFLMFRWLINRTDNHNQLVKTELIDATQAVKTDLVKTQERNHDTLYKLGEQFNAQQLQDTIVFSEIRGALSVLVAQKKERMD